tara:strand:+ start:3294 stop:3407 length:114 start_codon:yes stop_codon:yes gene_type:complete
VQGIQSLRIPYNTHNKDYREERKEEEKGVRRERKEAG